MCGPEKARQYEARMDEGEDPTLDDVTTDENATPVSDDVVKFNPATFTVLDAMNFYVQWLRENEKSAATITHVEAHKNYLKPIWKTPLLELKKAECHKLHKDIRVQRDSQECVC